MKTTSTAVAPCWICKRKLTIDTDGNGRQIEYCGYCWREIQFLRATLKDSTAIRRGIFVSPEPNGRKTKYDWILGLELWRSGLRVVEIAEILGCPRKRVYHTAERFDWPTRPKHIQPPVNRVRVA